MTSQELEKVLSESENEHIEFKEAKNDYDFQELMKYFIALANEGGGKMILGVGDKIPRKIIGTSAFTNTNDLIRRTFDSIKMRINIEEITCQEKRILIIVVPGREIGMPLEYHGAYWMRLGDSLKPMNPEKLKQIFKEESIPDFSAEICYSASIQDLDKSAIDIFRHAWYKKSKKENILETPIEQLLEDANLIIDGKITYAAIILLGTEKFLSRYLGQSEIILEYRLQESIPYQQRYEFCKGFFLFFDELWKVINQRNDLQHFQEGLFVWDFLTFNESVIRESILNAVTHREYRLTGSTIIRQFPKKIEIISPGGFPSGITPDNILEKQNPRNRRIAETFSKCGLVERSGQGFDKIFLENLKESKSLPKFDGTDDYQVFLTLDGVIQECELLAISLN